MDLNRFQRDDETMWRILPHGKMRVPGVIYASAALMREMDDKVYEQLTNVASLPGIQQAAYAMPDAHWGYGFPIGGVAAFDPEEGGVISAGGVGFDISCGVRLLRTSLPREALDGVKLHLADRLFQRIPAGLGSTGRLSLNVEQMQQMLLGGAAWALRKGYGRPEDLKFIEEQGCMRGAKPDLVSDHAKNRQRDEMGTLGSGNHYLELQEVDEIFLPEVAKVFGIKQGDLVVSIHCGSRGLGHQIGTEYLKQMVVAARGYGIDLPDRELACAPLHSDLGLEYLAAMRAAMNCAMANRQILTHLVREVFSEILPQANLSLLYDVSHNTCKEEQHKIAGVKKNVFVHRKGATRAFGPGHKEIPKIYRSVGQPVLIGGSMGTASYILVGTERSTPLSFASACHGAGRAMSRHAATKRWRGAELVHDLEKRGILIRSPSLRGVAEEAPAAYKDVSAVVDVADEVGLASKVARLLPLICIKG